MTQNFVFLVYYNDVYLNVIKVAIKAYHNVTGKAYEHQFKILKGKTTIPGKLLPPTNVKPKNLVGKKEGSTITIADQEYVIKDIQ